MFIRFFTCFILSLSAVAHADSSFHFQCNTVAFGEQLPLRLYAIKSEFLEECGDLCQREQVVRYGEGVTYQAIPDAWIHSLVTFNERLIEPKSQAKFKNVVLHPVKRFVFLDSSKNVYILETRYVDYPHLNFGINLECSDRDACAGEFVLDKSTSDDNPNVTAQLIKAPGMGGVLTQKLVLKINRKGLEDERPGLKEIRAEMIFGSKTPSRMIVRIFKENVSHNLGLNLMSSASIEADLGSRISEVNDSVEINGGTDEQLFLFNQDRFHFNGDRFQQGKTNSNKIDSADQELDREARFHRIAAAEIKIICTRASD